MRRPQRGSACRSPCSPRLCRGMPAILVLVALAGCGPSTLPSDESPHVSTRTPTATSAVRPPSPTVLPSATPSPPQPAVIASPPSPWYVPTAFVESIYPSPVPLSLDGAWPATAACPNEEGLEDPGYGPVVETVIDMVAQLNSGYLLAMRAITDPAYWPLLEPFTTPGPSPEMSWVLSILPASESTYAGLIRSQCGETILNVTRLAVICPGPCANGGSESLNTVYFFVVRRGHWLIWAVD